MGNKNLFMENTHISELKILHLSLFLGLLKGIGVIASPCLPCQHYFADESSVFGSITGRNSFVYLKNRADERTGC